MNRHNWTPAEDFDLRTYRAQGLSLPQVAQKMGLTFNCVRRRWQLINTGTDYAYSKGRTCSCGARLVNVSATGRCRRCHLKSPEFIQKRTEGSRTKWQSPEFREYMGKRGPKISETKMAHIPPAYRATYRHLTRKTHVKAVDAQRMVLEQERADEAKLSPFERQTRALKRGAQVVAKVSVTRHSPAATELRQKLA